jgi:hypothetical protein
MSDVEDDGDLFHRHAVAIGSADCLVSICPQFLLGFLELALAATEVACERLQPGLRLR